MIYSAKDSMNVERKVAIVTGANVGIGFEVARALVAQKAHVIVAARSVEKGERAVSLLKNEFRSANVEFMRVDLSSPSSIRDFADEFIKRGLPLHILVNNAGIAMVPYSKTVEGHEITHATNHLGTFLLTNLLLDTMKKSVPARVITTSSLIGQSAKIDLNDIGGDHLKSSDMSVYGTTKAYNIMFAQELEKRLKGTGVTSYVVQPGVAKSDIMNKAENKGPIRAFKMMKFMFQDSGKGAISAIHAATSRDVESYGASRMIGPNYMNIGNTAAKKITNPNVTENNNAILWERSATIVGI